MIEMLFALLVLSVGVLGVASMLVTGMTYVRSSQDDFIAQQKAAEAVESIFTARDTQAAAWAAIQNASTGGVFLDGPQQLCDPGPDGIVGTADDDCSKPDEIISPGPDGILGTADDVKTPLDGFKRTILIGPTPFGGIALRQITVTMTYNAGNLKKTYQVVTYISAVN